MLGSIVLKARHGGISIHFFKACLVLLCLFCICYLKFDLIFQIPASESNGCWSEDQITLLQQLERKLAISRKESYVSLYKYYSNYVLFEILRTVNVGLQFCFWIHEIFSTSHKDHTCQLLRFSQNFPDICRPWTLVQKRDCIRLRRVTWWRASMKIEKHIGKTVFIQKFHWNHLQGF